MQKSILSVLALSAAFFSVGASAHNHQIGDVPSELLAQTMQEHEAKHAKSKKTRQDVVNELVAARKAGTLVVDGLPGNLQEREVNPSAFPAQKASMKTRAEVIATITPEATARLMRAPEQGE